MVITNETEVHIKYKNFYIAHNKTHNTWVASHEDEELYEDDIIIDIPFEEPLELFDGFILDLQEFEAIQGLRDGLI